MQERKMDEEIKKMTQMGKRRRRASHARSRFIANESWRSIQIGVNTRIYE